jgi:hypothetical protein
MDYLVEAKSYLSDNLPKLDLIYVLHEDCIE